MLASLTRWPEERALLERGEWIFERKLDGLRGLAVRNGPEVELWSRNHLSFRGRFPGLVSALLGIRAGSFVLDGEIVAGQGDEGSFQALQRGLDGGEPCFVAFDLVHLLGHDIADLPLSERKDLLHKALEGAPPAIRLAEPLAGDAGSLMERACGSGWEGLVAKRPGSPYRPGRSGDWRKLKCSARQEMVVGGFTDPSGARTGFGALLLGYNDRGALRYAGKVGTGFDERTLRDLNSRLREIETDQSPFAERVPVKGAHWVRPTMVAEIAFSEWTRDGRMRHPSFMGLRPDKMATEVVREVPIPGPHSRPG